MQQTAPALETLLRDRICTEGPLQFDRFMETALYHPALGYYRSGTPRVGRAGDFFTSVSTGPYFGKLLARQVAEVWEALARPDPFRIVEQGADSGDLAADLLAAIERDHPELDRASHLVLIEPFPELASRQTQRLAAFREKVRHVERPELLPPLPSIHLSNELLDAFPVRVVEKAASGNWHELRVGHTGSAFAWEPSPDPAPIPPELAPWLAPLPAGYRTEWREGIRPWMEAVARTLTVGAMLLIDYGYPRDVYYESRRSSGSLSAYRNHQRCDNPLATPGAIDLTAHVDFTAVAEAAEGVGLRVAGFTDQGRYLLGLAQADFARWESDPETPAGIAERRSLQTLTHPGALGADFHALLLTRGIEPGPRFAGFAARNDAARLHPPVLSSITP